MGPRLYQALTGTLFAVIAIVHATRLADGWPVYVGTWEVPMGVSWLGVLLPGALAVWAFSLLRQVGALSR